MSGAENFISLSIDEHRELGREMKATVKRLRVLCALVVDVYGPANRAASSAEAVAVTRRTTCSARMISAGPAANALARKRGAIIAEFQNGLPPSPLYRNAVTV